MRERSRVLPPGTATARPHQNECAERSSPPLRVTRRDFESPFGRRCDPRLATAGGRRHVRLVIASVEFRRFKALRHTRVDLKGFNLVIGPNGSGKTSLIEAVVRLGTMAKTARIAPAAEVASRPHGPEIEFAFEPPHERLRAKLSCVSEDVCDLLQITPANASGWPALQTQLLQVRSYVLDHTAIAQPARRDDRGPLATDGGNLGAVLARLRSDFPDAYSALTAEVLRILPEFSEFTLDADSASGIAVGLKLAEAGVVPAAELSQGMLYLLAVLVLAFDPDRPRVLCIEEIDRGIHPRMLREVRDALYRLSYPESFGDGRRPVQVVATTHSPYLIDQFREHPEEIVISQKHGRAAQFERLSDRPDLPELLREGSLGDMWYSGILGGVPEER